MTALLRLLGAILGRHIERDEPAYPDLAHKGNPALVTAELTIDTTRFDASLRDARTRLTVLSDIETSSASTWRRT